MTDTPRNKGEPQGSPFLSLPPLDGTRAAFSWAEDITTVGVTGTNGKTSTVELLAAALAGDGRPVLSETTLGYQLEGECLEVERTVGGFVDAFRRAAQAGARRAAVEVTAQALARGFAKSWRFDHAIFTNLSEDHLSIHKTWEHYLASKAQLFLHLRPGASAILNACDPASLMIDRIMPRHVERVWFAGTREVLIDSPPALQLDEVRVSASGTTATLRPSPLANELGGSLTTKLVGDVFAENALAAAGAALAAGVPGDAVSRGLACCPVVPGRFQVIHQEPICVVDFAHTPDALGRACDIARQLASEGRVLVVFGAGGEKDTAKREPMGRAVGERADIVFVTNDNPRSENPACIADELLRGVKSQDGVEVHLELDRRQAIRQAVSLMTPRDVLLVAGKGHETQQIFADRREAFDDASEIRQALRG